MPDAALTQLGIGGIFVILVLRELLPFLLKSRRGQTHTNGNAGERPVEYWSQEFRKIIREEMGDLREDFRNFADRRSRPR